MHNTHLAKPPDSIMQHLTTLSQLREVIRALKSTNQRINFVATMGYLHAGHQQLIRAARREGEILIVSIFVNPLQFAAHEDLGNYPRALTADSQLCAENHVDILFTPPPAELVDELLTSVQVGKLGQHLCGRSRPGHFSGVATIVAKLFNLIQPDQAYFGEKDIQQLRIIQQMVQDLNFPVTIHGVATVRAADGLALSSRNSYLSADERQAALIVPQTLELVAQLLTAGQLTAAEILHQAIMQIKLVPQARLDYLEIVDYQNLQPTAEFKHKLIIATAIFIGTTRLIDNKILEGG